MKTNLCVVLALLAGAGIASNAAVTFTITPSAVSNTYTGAITLQVSNLAAGDTVVVQKYLDLNTNGVIDAGDWLVQQFQMTDGQAGMVIGGVTNFNVPGDTDTTAGQITAKLNFQNGDFTQNFVGDYLFELSSPAGHFAPITNALAVTNYPFGQTISGTVLNNGTAVSNAIVVLINGSHGKAVAGTVANNSGNYSIAAPAGTYGVVAFKSNYIVNYKAPVYINLTNTEAFATNVILSNTTASISGQLVDANNGSIGLPGVLFPIQSSNGLMAIGFTDTSGNFNVGVVSGQWSIKADDDGLIVLGYVGLQNKTNVSAGATGVTVAVPKATALIYGSVKDTLGNPLAGIDVDGYDNNYNVYETDGYTDAKGNYVLGVLALGANDPWSAQVSSDSAPTNYIFTQPMFDQDGGTNLNAGQAAEANITALSATNLITGYLTDNYGNPISGVGVYASATIAGNYWQLESVNTSSSGYYALNVANSNTWSVSVLSGCTNCNGDLPNDYLCPPSTNATINNDNATVNFTAIVATNVISGTVLDNNGGPIVGVGVGAYGTNNGQGYRQYADTGSTGYYVLKVANGTWNVGLNCCNGCGGDSLPSNYQCPNSQNIIIDNNSTNVSFTVYPSSNPNQIYGYVTDGNGNPISNMEVDVYDDMGDFYYSGMTDNNGYYSIDAGSGSWDVSVNCDDLTALGYSCIGDQQTQVSGGGVEVDFTVPCPSLGVTTTSPLPDGFVEQSYSFQLLGIGCNPPYTWSLTPGSLPLAGGLNVSNNGVIFGTPTTVSTNYFSIRITDSTGSYADQLMQQNIYPPLQMTPGTLPSGTVGISYTGQVKVSGGNPYVNADGFSEGYSGSYGTLPPGLGFSYGTITSSNEIFVISGMPTTKGTFQFQLGAQDADGNSVSGNYSITIAPATLQILTTNLSSATQKSYYTNQLQASGGTTPYTWTIALGSQPLPSGLKLSTNGLIFGTPATNGTFSFIARVTDANSLTTTRSLTLVISPLPVLSLPAWRTNQFQLRLTGGTGQTYTVEETTNLGSTNWTTLLVTNNAQTNSIIVTDPNATNKDRFYRVKVGL